jgi:hypothetical protein
MVRSHFCGKFINGKPRLPVEILFFASGLSLWCAGGLFLWCTYPKTDVYWRVRSKSSFLTVGSSTIWLSTLSMSAEIALLQS